MDWRNKFASKGERPELTQMKPVAASATFWFTLSFSAGRDRSFTPAATRAHFAMGAQKKMVLGGRGEFRAEVGRKREISWLTEEGSIGVHGRDGETSSAIGVGLGRSDRLWSGWVIHERLESRTNGR